MSVIDPVGLFGGDRLRRCSNAAQLHWPRLFLASDGFARLEINYARIIGRAYPTFNPIPSETELQAWIQEYFKNYLLFPFEVEGQVWGQWDTRAELLPRYKTSADRRSPLPPEPEFTEWKRRYREENKAFPKCFAKISEGFRGGVGRGVGGGVGKSICASPEGNAREWSLPSMDVALFETTDPGALQAERPKNANSSNEMTSKQEGWFIVWWPEYWSHKGKKNARAAFAKSVKTEARFHEVMEATRAQKPEMLARPNDKRPYPATWLNGERWEDETEEATPRTTSPPSDEYPELPDDYEEGRHA